MQRKHYLQFKKKLKVYRIEVDLDLPFSLLLLQTPGLRRAGWPSVRPKTARAARRNPLLAGAELEMMDLPQGWGDNDLWHMVREARYGANAVPLELLKYATVAQVSRLFAASLDGTVDDGLRVRVAAFVCELIRDKRLTETPSDHYTKFTLPSLMYRVSPGRKAISAPAPTTTTEDKVLSLAEVKRKYQRFKDAGFESVLSKDLFGDVLQAAPPVHINEAAPLLNQTIKRISDNPADAPTIDSQTQRICKGLSVAPSDTRRKAALQELVAPPLAKIGINDVRLKQVFGNLEKYVKPKCRGHYEIGEVLTYILTRQSDREPAKRPDLKLAGKS